MSVAAVQDINRDCHVIIQGERLSLDIAGCLYWAAEETLIFSDLHFEKGSSFASRGQLMPPFDTGATLRLMASRIDHWSPKRVISLGDSFHDDSAAHRLPPLYLQQLQRLMQGREWIWISGNHDPSPPDHLGGDCMNELAFGALTFRHEPAPVTSGVSRGEIAGHLHPAGKIRRRGKSVRRRCFIEDGDRLIMPSFGAYTGGLNVRDAAFDGLFDWARVHAHLISRDMLYTINAKQLVR